jgi:hypothetical protein
LGFDGVDAGGLDESWRQQPGTPAITETQASAAVAKLADDTVDGASKARYEISFTYHLELSCFYRMTKCTFGKRICE